MTFLLQTLLAAGQLLLAFYGLWLVWQVLLAVLPGPRDPAQRIARFAGDFLDPFVELLARALHVHARFVPAFLPIVVAAGQVALSHLSRDAPGKRLGACYSGLPAAQAARVCSRAQRRRKRT
ncbi:hypothetical protein [Deinococcus peraridilitoris]|uniref:hypothetical protein n=1 Tax=Deinococcus peraridilitoris TaxID=432329 RepID=UPI0002E39C38|nr:hypothetical protein [Deinococcus peraridilitoris]